MLLFRHIQDLHEHPEFKHFPQCLHGKLADRALDFLGKAIGLNYYIIIIIIIIIIAVVVVVEFTYSILSVLDIYPSY